MNKQSSKRYWANEKPNSFKPQKFIPISQNPFAEKHISETSDVVKPVALAPKFVPYSSILSGFNNPGTNDNDKGKQKQNSKKIPNFEKNKKSPKNKMPKTKFINPMSKGGFMKLQKLHKSKVEQHKGKKNQLTPKSPVKSHTILIEDSSENEDEVIAIEPPPPPFIDLDSSDESVLSKKEFMSPETKKILKNFPLIHSPTRPVSPSSNSMMSDDFIVIQHKGKLKEKELQVKSTTKNSIKDNKCTNKTLGELKIVKPSSTSSSAQNTDRSSCEKEKEAQEKSKAEAAQTPKKPSKDLDTIEYSVYGSKTKKIASRKRSISNKPSENDSSSDTQNIVVAKKPKMKRRKSAASKSSGKNTGDSDSEKEMDPKHKLFASTPREAKKKRKNFVSESYQDDEFNTMLSTIVQNDDADVLCLQDSESLSGASIKSPLKVPSQAGSYMTIDEVGASSAEENAVTRVETIIDKIPHKSKKKPEVLEVADDTDQDCTIIEKPIVTINVDDDSPYINEFGEKVITARRWVQQIPDGDDIMLNIQKNKFEPHEYIRDYDPSQPKALRNNQVIADELSRSNAGWNDEMKIFYNESWGGENFHLNEVLNKMPRK